MQDADAMDEPKSRNWMLVVWPAFLAACVLEVLVFSVIDPGEIHWPGHITQPTHQAVYSLAFFVFWVVITASNGLVLRLARPEQVREDPGRHQ